MFPYDIDLHIILQISLVLWRVSEEPLKTLISVLKLQTPQGPVKVI